MTIESMTCFSERALLAVTLTNEVDEILAHAAFHDYPNVASVDPAGWVEWLHVYFDAPDCSSLNSMFLHYFVSKPDYAHGCARELISTMFSAIPDVHYCLLAVPTTTTLGNFSCSLFVCLASRPVQAPGL